MFKLDNNFLIELGLGDLPPVEKNKMLAHIYETLEMRVGMKLAEQMSNEQLDEFESYIKQNDEDGALKWLEGNFPNYKQVVATELDTLKGEIKQVAPQIVAQAQQQAAAAPQPQQQVPPPVQQGTQPAQQMPPRPQQTAPQQQPMQQPPVQPQQPMPPQAPPTQQPYQQPPQPQQLPQDPNQPQ